MPVIAGVRAAEAAEAQAASGTYGISVMISSPEDGCYATGANTAVQHFVKRKVEEINQSGALNGRRLSVDFYDDNQDVQQSIVNMRRALADKSTIGIVGMPGWRRAKDVFDKMGGEIGTSGIPFVSDISVNRIFKEQANVFTMRASQEDERLPVIGRVLKDQKFQRPAFIGVKDEEGSSVLGDGLKTLRDVPTIVADTRVTLTEKKISDADLAQVLADLKAKDADIAMISLGGDANAQFLKAATEAGLNVAVFVFGNAENALKDAGLKAFGGDLYQLAWEGLPGVYSDRLRQHILKHDTDRWLFPDKKRVLAKGWITGKCEAQYDDATDNVLDTANLRAIGRGTQYADMVGMIAELIKNAPAREMAGELRKRIVDGIGKNYETGHGTYRGAFDNWSFRPDTRTASRTPLILKRPRGLETAQLAPDQYTRLRDDSLRRIQTLYMDVDLIRIFRVDDREKSFFADFYLTLTNAGKLTVADLEFGNAFVDPESSGAKLAIATLHDGGQSDAYPEGSKIYKVSGKFMFRPDFARFPFDTQLFSVDVQPKSGDVPFVIQPPGRDLRDKTADTEGWQLTDQYVGYDEDVVPVIDARNDQRSVVPFYKGSFAWIMDRQATDYYLQVVIPLAFILIVAYLSIFIPKENFEAVVTIQVTALLSAVALYLSIPKVASDTATISDRIFLVDYMAVSLMIVISIMRVNPRILENKKFASILDWVHVAGIPILVGVMLAMILGHSPVETSSMARL